MIIVTFLLNIDVKLVPKLACLEPVWDLNWQPVLRENDSNAPGDQKASKQACLTRFIPPHQTFPPHWNLFGRKCFGSEEKRSQYMGAERSVDVGKMLTDHSTPSWSRIVPNSQLFVYKSNPWATGRQPRGPGM